MADTLTPPPVAHPSKPTQPGTDLGDAGARGTLTIHDKVVQSLAARAALDTAGVQRHSGGIDKLTGRDLPRVHVQIAGDRVRAAIDVAVAWAWPLPTVTADVQANVTHALTAWAGLHVDAVDVSVPSVVEPDAATPPEGPMTTHQTIPDDSPYDTTTSSATPRPDVRDQTTSGPALTPAAARTPRAPAAASYSGAVLSVLLVAVGVLGIRDGLTAAGALRGSLWSTDAVNWIDGLRFAYWMIPAGFLAVILGAILVLIAVAPRRRPTRAMTGRTSVVIGHRDLARIAASVTQTVPGVTNARAASKGRTVTVTARTTGQDPATVKAAITTTVGDSLAVLSQTPKIVVRTRTESHS